MRAIIIGVLVAGAIIAAFATGVFVEEENDGPLEEIGETLDEETG